MRQKSSMPSNIVRVMKGATRSMRAPAASNCLMASPDRLADLGVDRQADAGVHHHADAQAGDVALETLPFDRLRRQAHRIALVGLRETPISSAASATVRVIGPATLPAYGGSIGIRPRLGFSVKMPHQPAGRRTEPPMSVPTCSGP